MKRNSIRLLIPVVLAAAFLLTSCDDLLLGVYPEFKTGICSIGVHVKMGDAITARGDFKNTSVIVGLYLVDNTVYSGANPYQSTSGATPKLQEFQVVRNQKEFDVVFEHKPEQLYQVFVWYELNEPEGAGVDPTVDFSEPSVLATNRADGRFTFDFSRKGAPAAYEAEAELDSPDQRIDKAILMALDSTSRIVYAEVKVSDAVKTACEADGSPVMVALIPLKETDLDWGTLDISGIKTQAFYAEDFTGSNENMIQTYFVPVPDGRYYVFAWRDALNNVPLSMTKDIFENDVCVTVTDSAKLHTIRSDYRFNSTTGLFELLTSVIQNEAAVENLRNALTSSGWNYGDLRPNYDESSLLLYHKYNDWSYEPRIRVSSSGDKSYQVEGVLNINDTTDFTRQFNSEMKNLEVRVDVGPIMRRWLYSIEDKYDPDTWQPILYTALIDVTDRDTGSVPKLVMKSYYTDNFSWGRNFNFPLRPYHDYQVAVWVETKADTNGIPEPDEIGTLAQTDWDDQETDDEIILGYTDENNWAGARLFFADTLTDDEFDAIDGSMETTTYRNVEYSADANKEFFELYYKSYTAPDDITRALKAREDFTNDQWDVYESNLDRLFFILRNLDTDTYPSGVFTASNLDRYLDLIEDVDWE